MRRLWLWWKYRKARRFFNREWIDAGNGNMIPYKKT